MKFVTIGYGCAECHGDSGEPIIEVEGRYETLAEAKEKSGEWIGGFKPHPQGGEFNQGHSGGVWIIPIDLFRSLVL